MRGFPGEQQVPLYLRMSSGPLLLLGVLEVLIGNFAEPVGSLKQRQRAFVSGVFAIGHEASRRFDSLRAFSGVQGDPCGPIVKKRWRPDVRYLTT